MKTTVNILLKETTINWIIPLILGIAFIAISIILIAWPLESYEAVSFGFGISILAAGILEIIYAITGRKGVDGKVWFFLGGIINLYVGILFTFNTELTMLILPYYFGFWLLFRSFLLLGSSYDIKRAKLKYWPRFLVSGLLTLIVANLIILNPLFGEISIVFLLAVSFLALGLFNLVLSVNLKKINTFFKS